MNDVVGTTGGKLAHATVDNATYVAGRRSFFKYRDLGVTDATGGKMRAQVTSATQGLGEPTGWHYHVLRPPACLHAERVGRPGI